jgi:hypothetical protein
MRCRCKRNSLATIFPSALVSASRNNASSMGSGTGSWVREYSFGDSDREWSMSAGSHTWPKCSSTSAASIVPSWSQSSRSKIALTTALACSWPILCSLMAPCGATNSEIAKESQTFGIPIISKPPNRLGRISSTVGQRAACWSRKRGPHRAPFSIASPWRLVHLVVVLDARALT